MDTAGPEAVVLGEMGAHSLHQIAAVMLDPATRIADEVELVVGMGHLPSGRSVAAGR